MGVFPCYPGAVEDRWGHFRFSLVRDMPYAKVDGTRKLRSLISSWASPVKQDTGPFYVRGPTPEAGTSVTAQNSTTQLPMPRNLLLV